MNSISNYLLRKISRTAYNSTHACLCNHSKSRGCDKTIYYANAGTYCYINPINFFAVDARYCYFCYSPYNTTNKPAYNIVPKLSVRVYSCDRIVITIQIEVFIR